MDQYGLTQLSVGRTNLDQGVNHRLGDRSTYTVVEKLAGLLGQFNWDVFYQYGRYEDQSTFTNERINSRFDQAVDVIEGLSGPECADAAAVAAGCEPLNVFGPNAASAAALAYFHYNPVTLVENAQQVMGAQTEGSLLSLPGGPLALSLGTEYRQESQDVQQDGLGAEGALFSTYGPSSTASFSVKEAYAEVLAPVLKDAPFAKTLQVDGAVRESDYNTVGSATTWRLGLQWAPTSDVRFRVTRSYSVRAPNLTELYTPGQGTYTTYYDPCSAIYINQGSKYRVANCAALGIPAGYVDPLAPDQREATTLGNTALKPEKSRDWTVGFVLTPRVVPNLTVEVDWWSIDIAEAIDTLPQQEIINSCVDSPTLSNPYCPLVQRNGTFQGRAVGVAITNVNLVPLNIGALDAEGVDFNVGYGLHLGSHFLGQENGLNWSLAGSYYIKNNSEVNANDPSDIFRLAGETVLPKLRVNLTTQFTAGPLSFDWIVRYIGRAVVDENDGWNFYEDNRVGSVVYHDLFASYDIGNRVTISGGVNNALNRSPPTNDSIGVILGELAQPYDYVGRYFFLQGKVKF
jgi:outer membrane receptor protein involved in Fe transport